MTIFSGILIGEFFYGDTESIRASECHPCDEVAALAAGRNRSGASRGVGDGLNCLE